MANSVTGCIQTEENSHHLQLRSRVKALLLSTPRPLAHARRDAASLTYFRNIVSRRLGGLRRSKSRLRVKLWKLR
jgi:hypothetical protein